MHEWVKEGSWWQGPYAITHRVCRMNRCTATVEQTRHSSDRHWFISVREQGTKRKSLFFKYAFRGTLEEAQKEAEKYLPKEKKES